MYRSKIYRPHIAAALAGVAYSALLHVPAQANSKVDADASNEIVVTASSIRDSMTKSLDIQREAPNIVNAITADSAGRFPDQTVAGALARLPGIGVQRDQGQERYVQVRGAPTRWTVVSFDGLNVLGSEERIFRFDSVPAALISTVELNKTLLPDMPAEALAGRVNIKTYSAMDNPGLHGLLDLGYGFLDMGGGTQEQASGRLSWSNDRVGITVAGSHYMFEQQADNTEPRYDAAGLMREQRNAKYITWRETNSLSGKLEFQPADDHKLTVTSLYTEFLDKEERHQYTFNLAGGTGTRTATNAELVAVPVVGAFQEGEYKNSTWVNHIHGDHQFGDWQVGWDAAYVETEAMTDLPIVNQSASDPALRPSLDFSVGDYNLGVFSLRDTIRIGSGFVAGAARPSIDQHAFDTETLTVYNMGNKTRSYTGKLDIARDWSSFGGDSILRFGMQYDDRKMTDQGNKVLMRPDGTRGTLSFREVAAELDVPWTPQDFVSGGMTDENVHRGYTTNYLNNSLIRSQIDNLFAAAEAANAAGGNFLVPVHDPLLANSVKERVIAGYISNSWQWDRLSLIAGVRAENTKITAVGAASVAGALQPIRINSDKTYYFPSLHLSFDATDELKLRGAFVTGAARPSFAEQRASVSINDSVGSQAINGGNPYLKPERAWGFDGSAEWYFAPGSLLSASGFYRKVSNVLFDTTGVVGDDRYNFGDVDRSNYLFSSTMNGDGGKLYGAEFSYTQPFTFLPGALSGFGVQGSIAFIGGEFETPEGRKVKFPGTSKRITNLSAYYEKYGFSARIGYQHRTGWLDDISVDATRDLYWDATERVDASLRYAMNENLTFYADLVNLTDENGVRYEGDLSRPYEVEGFGRRFLFGVRIVY